MSFSGGKTSGFMSKMLRDNYANKYDLAFVFANTGQENEETLVFADRCDREWSLDLAWVEALVHYGERRSSSHKIVNFQTASRNGEPFEDVIKKYGIPNNEFLHCTRELKSNPIRSYIERGLGWERGTYQIAIGIRGDEPKRSTYDPKGEKIYPLAQRPNLLYEEDFLDLYSTKPVINDWWDEQPFNLHLLEHEGNCKTCHKKSTSKLVRIAIEHPERYEFTKRMERIYSTKIREGSKSYIMPPYYFYRGNMNTESLLNLASMSSINPYPIDRQDENSGCSESCEAF